MQGLLVMITSFQSSMFNSQCSMINGKLLVNENCKMLNEPTLGGVL